MLHLGPEQHAICKAVLKFSHFGALHRYSYITDVEIIAFYTGFRYILSVVTRTVLCNCDKWKSAKEKPQHLIVRSILT